MDNTVLIDQPNLHDAIVDTLRRMIVAGDLRPGEPIPEPALCRQLGISRTPLREALKVLAFDQWVELVPNRGAVVTTLTPEEATALFELLEGLEQVVGELAASRATAEELVEIRAMHDVLGGHFEAGDLDAYFTTNQQIHHHLVQATRNPALISTHENLSRKVLRARAMANLMSGRQEASFAEHAAILAALEQREGALLGRLLRAHLHDAGVAVREALAARHAGLAPASSSRVTRIGILTPSSNTALEPAIARLLHDTPTVSAHFSRFRVTEIALSDESLSQFDDEPILAAATLLAQAKVDVIVWSGTSASWLGIERDRALCRRLTQTTGIPATTAILALQELMTRMAVRRLGLVTPYTDDVQRRIVATLGDLGVACASEQHLHIADNFAFAEVPQAAIAGMIRGTAQAAPDAIAVVCTNVDASRLGPEIEAETGIAVLDSIVCTLWAALDTLRLPKAPYRRWGRLFDC